MSNTQSTGAEHAELSREDMMSALFANLVIQQTNTAFILMGRAPNPETGETMQDLEAARMFIDQLEMLEVKTKGNLEAREQKLLQQSLMSLRMAFVEAVETPAPSAKPAAPSPAGSEPASRASAASTGDSAPTSAAPPEESHKKFSKKY